MSEKRVTRQGYFADFCENVSCPHKYIEEIGCSIQDCENCYFNLIYTCLSEFEDKIENGQLGDVAAYEHRIKVLEKALKKVINEYTYDGEITVPGCEDCDIALGRPSQKCLQTQFNRLVEQAEQELQEEKK